MRGADAVGYLLAYIMHTAPGLVHVGPPSSRATLARSRYRFAARRDEAASVTGATTRRGAWLLTSHSHSQTLKK